MSSPNEETQPPPTPSAYPSIAPRHQHPGLHRLRNPAHAHESVWTAKLSLRRRPQRPSRPLPRVEPPSQSASASQCLDLRAGQTPHRSDRQLPKDPAAPCPLGAGNRKGDPQPQRRRRRLSFCCFSRIIVKKSVLRRAEYRPCACSACASLASSSTVEPPFSHRGARVVPRGSECRPRVQGLRKRVLPLTSLRSVLLSALP